MVFLWVRWFSPTSIKNRGEVDWTAVLSLCPLLGHKYKSQLFVHYKTRNLLQQLTSKAINCILLLRSGISEWILIYLENKYKKKAYSPPKKTRQTVFATSSFPKIERQPISPFVAPRPRCLNDWRGKKNIKHLQDICKHLHIYLRLTWLLSTFLSCCHADIDSYIVCLYLYLY